MKPLQNDRAKAQPTRKVAGNTLVGTLVVVAIILVLVVVFMRGGVGGLSVVHPSPRQDGKGVTTMGLAEAVARDEVCRNNLSQIRQSIQVAESSDSDGHPTGLDQLKLPADMLRCPIGHEAYIYDPQAGTVHCPHPGHERF